MNFTSSPFERMMKEVPHPGWDNDDPCKGYDDRQSKVFFMFLPILHHLYRTTILNIEKFAIDFDVA